MEKNQQNTLLTNLYNSRGEGQLGIVVMKCTGGRVVLAHKYALTAGSDYFRGMFSYNNIENETNVVSFDDTSAEVMEIVVKCIYAQNLPTPPEITDTLVRETFIAADKMQITALFDKYWTFYTTPITLDNFLNVWPLADMFNQHKTKENIRKFVLKNTEQISNAESLADISAEIMADIFAHTVGLVEPDKLGDVIKFLIDWVDKKTSLREQRMKCVSELLSEFDINKIPDHALRKLMSNDEMDVKTPTVYDLLSKNIVRRWLTDARPHLVIHAFENFTRKWKHSIFDTTSGEWMMPVKKELKNLNQWFPGVSGTGGVFYWTFSHAQRSKASFVAYESSTKALHECAVYADLKLRSVSCETANCDAIYFKRTPETYSRFDFRSKRWDVVDFKGLIKDCECMLLANDEKYFFDVDDRRIMIVDRESETCVTKEKLAGSWRSVRCKNLCGNGSGKLVFFQKGPSKCLLIYDIGNDSWRFVLAPNIIDELAMCVCFYEDCLVFEKSVDSCNVYSLESMAKVAEYKIPVEYEGRLYFDVSVKKKVVLF